MPWSVYNSNGKLLQSLAIGDDSIVEGKLDVSNAPTNGYFLQAQSGEGGGLTWAAASSGPSQATQAALEAETNEDTYAPPDLIKHSPGVAKVWCQWEQTGAHGITGSYNMTSVTDGGSGGNTDHLFATDFSNANYTIVSMSADTSYMEHEGVSLVAGGITTVTIHPQTGGGVDKNWNHIVVFGDQ